MDEAIGRGATKASSDPRAEKTRQEIFAAVRTIATLTVASKRNEGFTVTDIVNIAGVSRSSFYAHFASLDELATQFIREEFAAIGLAGVDLDSEDSLTGVEAARIGYTRLIAHMVEHFPLYSTVLSLPETRSAYDGIVEAYAKRLLETVMVLSTVPDGVDADIVTTYIAGGALTVIGTWMRGTLDASDDELVDQLVALLPAWLTDARASTRPPSHQKN
ncbi:TetR/AcrR family transcriptional regulator [Galbitalea soli]|uniref:TetR/AcrR family transcriptional regulator n=1 Tax=Galbitalea soli TaxID=1268042 RepID=A0A7C9PNA3_9MICO|nr:TetR/AcrR family transcriptional regulator [Galbitalea soli]NEM91510.1 TetR/AcrR family transcriptional regulator [Galbitalea soli]NYJ30203.1 AcrR family transcriptional regulator [Galbitalea soli]